MGVADRKQVWHPQAIFCAECKNGQIVAICRNLD
jgi:hypothetical protein